MEIQFVPSPGIVRAGTERNSAGRWYDGNLIRWLSGILRPVYGWAQHSASALSGAGRALVTWRDNSNNSWIGVGTHSHLYVMDRAGNLTDITPVGFTSGRVDASFGTGYNGGNYGSGTYGTPRPDTNNILDATVWSLDTWGQDLVGVSPDDGKMYEWVAPTTGAPAAQIANSPTCYALVVTAERFLVALGSTDPRTVQWSDLENNTLWTPDATNEAGSFPLQTFGRLICGRRLAAITGLWTDTDMWAMTYIGGTLIYAFNKVGSGCGAISRQCVAVMDSTAAWMGENGFFLYNGYVQALPCDVQDYVFGNINKVQLSKVTAVLNSQFGEVWWFYPSAGSSEIDSAVSWSYRDNIWMIHHLSRTCGADASGAFAFPVMFNIGDGLVYEHETGFSYDGAEPFAETGPMEFAAMAVTYTGSGASVWQASKFIPDEFLEGDVQATFKAKIYPNGTETDKGPYTLLPKTDVRFTGRQAKMRVTGVRNDDWRFGNARLEINGHGSR